MRVDFQLDPESSMIDIPKSINREKMVTIIGNLLKML
ncbi:MAG: hypothetical protein CM1200mP28_13340 [Deltaproteobacteria bacterium]|nr:MAG: hypothetical protein CM1200mP28_13340 [Deltaproteobacteria bacterium]